MTLEQLSDFLQRYFADRNPSVSGDVLPGRQGLVGYIDIRIITTPTATETEIVEALRDYYRPHGYGVVNRDPWFGILEKSSGIDVGEICFSAGSQQLTIRPR